MAARRNRSELCALSRLKWAHSSRNAERAFQSGAVPASGLGCGRIGRRQEVEQQGIRVRRLRDRVVRQDELSKRCIEGGAARRLPVAKTRRFGIGVGVEGGAREGLIARPEPGAAHFVRIGFTGDGVGQAGHAARMKRRATSGEPRHREIEAAPKEMDRARLAQEPRAEELEDAIRLQ